jgi:hypothetical protein
VDVVYSVSICQLGLSALLSVRVPFEPVRIAVSCVFVGKMRSISLPGCPLIHLALCWREKGPHGVSSAKFFVVCVLLHSCNQESML